MTPAREARAFLEIVALGVGAAIFYGILHDQITARICREYFTVFHPPIFGGTQDPTLLALGWGVIATWWVGLPLGILLAASARLGSWPRLTARQLLRPILTLLLVMAVCAALAGSATYGIERAQAPPGDIASSWPEGITRENRARFLADLATHNTSYVTGFIGGIVLASLTVRRRYYRNRHAAE